MKCSLCSNSAVFENPLLCKSLGRSGNQYVKTQYNWRIIMHKYQQFFDKIYNQGEENGIIT